jgi:hypothetical protein
MVTVPIVSSPSCCQIAKAAQPDGFAWLSLPFRGVQDDGGLGLELRDCVCGSTLALPLTAAVLGRK